MKNPEFLHIFHPPVVPNLIGGLCALALISTPAMAATWAPPSCCVSVFDPIGGATCTKFTCNGTEYEHCTECETGYTLVQKTIKPCGSQTYTYSECQKDLIVKPTLGCEAGQYGLRKCEDCPTPGTSAEGAALITECYIPAGNGETDTTGKWEYTNDCYYTK